VQRRRRGKRAAQLAQDQANAKLEELLYAVQALGLEGNAKRLGQITGPVLGGVLVGASVAAPLWLPSEALLGLAPILAKAVTGSAFDPLFHKVRACIPRHIASTMDCCERCCSLLFVAR